jgi:hypothetical protein
VYSERSLRADTPFGLFTSADTETLGGYGTSRWTWSGLNSRRPASKSPQAFRYRRGVLDDGMLRFCEGVKLRYEDQVNVES